MQLFFAVAGESVRSGPVFRDMLELTRQSNPDSEITVIEQPGIHVGVESRAFEWIAREDLGVSLFLDGTIRTVAGVPVAPDAAGREVLEQLLRCYQDFGDEVWEQLDGSFRLVIVDRAGVRAGTDVAGTRALYWWAANGMWACHSHLMDLAPVHPHELTTDLGAIGQFCENGRYPPTRTAFLGLQHLGAGQCLKGSGDGVVQRDHFSRAPAEPVDGHSMSELAGEMIERTRTAIASSLGGADRPVIPLSGGLDSRFIVALAVEELGPAAVRTITWGEGSERPHSDAAVAREVAAYLGVEHGWHPKAHAHTVETFSRAIYLSSGETDHAIHYPDDHILHAELAGRHGFGSLARGDELLGGSQRRHKALTTRGAIGTAGLHRISLDQEYPDLIGSEVTRAMASEQDRLIREIAQGLQAESAYGKFLELYYIIGVRRHCGPYNAVKNADLEVLTPLLDRALNEWLRHLPDEAFVYKLLLRMALEELDPELAALPYATTSNDGSWAEWWSSRPPLPGFFAEWCTQPGWLADIGASGQVTEAALAMVEQARLYQPSQPDPVSAPEPSRPGGSSRIKGWLRATRAGQLMAEQTLQYRVTRQQLPRYMRISRLAVLHWLIGDVTRRRATGGLGRQDRG